MKRKWFLILASCIALGSTAVQAEDIRLKSRDGKRVRAISQSVAQSTRGVVLVHMEGRSAQDYRFLVERLNRNGFHTIAVDLRGHGANVPQGATAPALTEDDWWATRGEIAAAVAWFRKHGVSDISLLGASVGANLVAHVAAGDPSIKNLILLSPGMDIQGITAADAVVAYGKRPLLIAVSEGDRYAAMSALVLDADAVGEHHLEIYRSAGHGTQMLNKAPGLEPLIISWLLGTYGGVHLSPRSIVVGNDSAN
jgi:alpha-beta hydrolase superfamily lysophospholipase